MDRKQCSKRYLSLVLALIMLIGTIPIDIFAQEPTTGTCTADPNKVSQSSIVKDPDKKQGPPTKDKNGVILEGFDDRGQEYVAADKVITKASDATNQKGVFGRAYDMTGADFNAADNNNPVPDDTVIYFQWMDSDGAKSPIFTCKTYHVGNGAKDGGWYAYDPDKLDFKDGNGKVHKLAYQTVRQYYRFWLAPGQKSPNGNTWTTARQAPGGQVGFYRATQTSGGSFMLAGSSYQKTAVFVYETPDDISYMVAPKGNSTFTGKNGQTYPRYKIDKVGIEEERGIDNYITGKVWWELSDNLVTFPTSTADTQVPQNTTEDGLKGIRVISSALTAQGANALKNINNLPINERIKQTKEILTAHPEYIMQTVEAPVVYEGKGNVSKYVARFDDNIDFDFIYQFVIDGQGNVLNVQNMSPIPVFSNPREFVQNTAARTPGRNNRYNVHNALVNDPFKSSIHITNYDTTVDGAASPEDVVKTSVEANYLPGNKVEIVWVDSDGNELSAKEVTNKTDAEAQTFTVPKTLTEKTVYSVQLRINGIIIDSDSFIADPSTKIRLHRNSSADDKYVDIIKVEDPDSQKVELQALRNTDKYQEVQNKYFVGWSTKKNATQPDENILINKSTLTPDSTTDLYVRDGSVYKYRDANCVPVKDLYAVWKDPMTVKATKEWVDTAAANYDTSKLKFGLLHRAAVGSFGKEVVAGLATYEPVKGQIKDYNENGLEWKNLPSYKEEGKRISYLIVELPTQEMVNKYNAGSTDWDSYNINVVEVKQPTYSYHKKEQTLSMKHKSDNGVDAITSSTKRLHLINGQAVDPHDPNLTSKPGYFDTQGYVITVTNKKQKLTPPSIEQAKSGDTELVINLKAGEDIAGLKGTLTLDGTATDFVIKKDSSTNTWTITKADGSAFTGVTVDTSSTADKVVLKVDNVLKADDKLVARTYKTVDGNDVVSSDDTMTVKDNNSRLPKNIKQAYSDKDDKVVITATPFQQDVNGQMITVVPSTTTYKLVDKDGNQIAGTPTVLANNNEIKFEIDKDKVSEDVEYFIQAKEPDRDAKDTREVAGVASEKGVASDKSVKIDKTAPQGTIPDIKGFVGNKIEDKTFDITEASEKINILEKEGPNGLKASISGNQITISGTPTVPYNGQTKLIVEDMFGNKGTLTGNADVYAKVVDKVPDGEGDKYYSVTFKSDNNSWLLNNDVKINTITKYIIKDFNGDGQVDESDKVTLKQAQDEGLMIPQYEVRDGYKVKTPNWEPNFEADDYKFGPNDATFTLQTEKSASIIPVKPGNDGTLPETPKGYVRVTLDKDKTVKFKDNVETIYDVRVADNVRYADVYDKVNAEPVNDSYKNVSWYKGNDKVKGTEIITEKMTLTAKAENNKPIIPVEDPTNNPNPPAGYVRITIAKGDRITSVTGVTTYDVKSDGSVTYGDIIDEVTKNGSKTVITIAKDAQGNATGRLPYTWKVNNADVVKEAVPRLGDGETSKTLTVSATMLDKDKYNPEGFEQTVKQGDPTPLAKDSIKNNGDLPDGTTYKYVKEEPANSGNFSDDSPKTDTIGEVPVKVLVTYPDKTSEIVDTKIKVVPKDNIIPVKPGDGGTLPDTPKDYVRVTLTKDNDSIKDYAEGTVTVYDVKKDAGVRLGDILNKVNPEAKDGYKNPKWYVNNAAADPLKPITDTVTANAKAEKTDASTYDPKGTVQNVEKGSTPDPKKSIQNPDDLPKGTEFKYVKEDPANHGTFVEDTPKTDTIGEVPVKVQVTYPDGSTDIVDTKINVVPKDKIIKVDDPDNNPNPPQGYIRVKLVNDATSVQTYKEVYDVKTDGTVLYGDVINRATAPQPSAGYKEPITWKNGDVVQDVRAIVTGSENVTLTAFATKTDASTYDPQGKEQTVEKGSTPDPKNSIENPEKLPEGTTYTYVKEKTDGEGNKTYTPENPDTSTTGEKDVKVQVTYPDGSTDIVETKIKVVEKAKKISEELEGKLEGKDINVWKDSPVDEINWKDGVKLNDANKDNETYKGYLENATAKEATDPARQTNEVGTKVGQIKVTFEDGSSLVVDKQNLVVKDNILPGDDNNAPKDAIEVKFLLGEGVKATKDGGEIKGNKTTPAEYASYKIKPGTNLKSHKLAAEDKTIFEKIAATVIDDTYENVVWKGNVTNDPTNYVVSKDNNEFTASASKKGSNKDIIPYIPDDQNKPTNPDDKNVPTEDPDGNPINKDDYVIVAFKIGQPGAATLVLDGKKGEVVSALVKKTDPMKKWGDLTLPTIAQTMDQNNQYTFEKWVDTAKAEMTADKQIADKAVYTATFKTNNGFDKDAIIGFNFVKDPTKMEYNEGDKPKHDGLEIELVDKNNNKVTVTKDELKDYGITIEPKEDTALTKGDDGKHLVAKITTKDGYGQDKELTASSPGTLTVKEKSNKDIIPFVPDKPEDPTNPNDKNVPTEDPDGNPINKDDYIIVAFKIGQPGAATLVLDGKKGEVVSALVKKTDPMKKWSEITIPSIAQTMEQNNQYTFEKWVDAAKAEMTADKQIADKAVYTATFKTNNGFDKDAIIGFKFVKDPTKMEYNEGDKPKHDGLEIELVDKNNNKVTVTKDELKDYGITIEPKEDTALTKEDDGKHLVAKITTKDGDGQDKELTASSPGTLTVNEKSDPTKDADKYTPEYKDGKGNPGEDVKVPAPEFKDDKGNPTTKPDGTKFTPGEDTPDGVTINEETGEITVKVPEDKKPGDKITVPVVITYPDGSKDNTTVTVTVTNPEDKTKDPTINQPYEGDNKITGKGEPESTIVVELPDGTKVPGKVDKYGNWTVDVPADKPLKAGDTIKVTQTDKNGKTKEATKTVASKFKPQPIPTPEYNPFWPIYFGSTKTEVKPEPKHLERHEAYIAGYPDGTVRPDGKITRAEVAAILARLTENSSLANFVARFSDVKASDWFSDSIMKLSAKDIITGYPDGTFKPNKSITRAEFAAIVSKYIKNPKAADEVFADVPMNHWAKDAIAKVKAEGWISGYNDGTFRPDAPITRAEAVSIINRMFGRSADGEFVREHGFEIKKFNDLTDKHWAYYEIMEAVHTHDYERIDKRTERWDKIVK